jgi:hypothetical protein
MEIDIEQVNKELAAKGVTLDEWFDTRFAQKMAEREAGKVPKLSMLVSKGNLDRRRPGLVRECVLYLLWSQSAQEGDLSKGHGAGQYSHADEHAVRPDLVPRHRLEYSLPDSDQYPRFRKSHHYADEDDPEAERGGTDY